MEAPTPHSVQKNVFKRLFKDRNADARTSKVGSQKSPACKATVTFSEKLPNKSMPSKGRQVSSKFSGLKANTLASWSNKKFTSKHESQRHGLTKRLAIKTPNIQVGKSHQPRGASIVSPGTKFSDKAPASVRLARSKLQSARYWLSLIGVAEKAGNHVVSMGLFRLAMDCAAQPASDIRKNLTIYKGRYKLENLDQKGELEISRSHTDELHCDLEIKQNDIVSDICLLEAETDTQHAPVQSIGRARAHGAEVENAVEVLNESINSEIYEEVKTIKNLYAEEYSQIPVHDDVIVDSGKISKDMSSKQQALADQKQALEEDVTSEVIDAIPCDDKEDVTSKLELLLDNTVQNLSQNESEDVGEGSLRKPVEEALGPRRTPRRACAIRAALKMEESAKKGTRKRLISNKSEHKGDIATPAATSIEGCALELEKMDVNDLMREVVSCMLSGSAGISPQEGHLQVEHFSKGPVLRSASKGKQGSSACAANLSLRQKLPRKEIAKEINRINSTITSSDGGTGAMSRRKSHAGSTSANSGNPVNVTQDKKGPASQRKAKKASNQLEEFQVVKESIKWKDPSTRANRRNSKLINRMENMNEAETKKDVSEKKNVRCNADGKLGPNDDKNGSGVLPKQLESETPAKKKATVWDSVNQCKAETLGTVETRRSTRLKSKSTCNASMT